MDDNTPNTQMLHQIEILEGEVSSLKDQMQFLQREIRVREDRIQDTLLQLQGQLAFSFDARDIRL